MHPSKRVFQNRGHKKKTVQVKPQQKRRNNHQHRRPYRHNMNDNVTQAELDASIEHIVEKEFIIKVPREHKALLDKHLELKRTIKNINARLMFGYSEPLQDYRDTLLKEDFAVLADITKILCQLKSL